GNVSRLRSSTRRSRSHAWTAFGIAALSLATLASCQKKSGSVVDSSTGARSVIDRSQVDRPALLDPSRSAETAPEVFRVRFETSRGPFVMEAHRAWAPWGVDRFYYLVKRGFYDGTRFF